MNQADSFFEACHHRTHSYDHSLVVDHLSRREYHRSGIGSWHHWHMLDFLNHPHQDHRDHPTHEVVQGVHLLPMLPLITCQAPPPCFVVLQCAQSNHQLPQASQTVHVALPIDSCSLHYSVGRMTSHPQKETFPPPSYDLVLWHRRHQAPVITYMSLIKMNS